MICIILFFDIMSLKPEVSFPFCVPVQIVSLLLESGVEVNVRNYSGQVSVLDLMLRSLQLFRRMFFGEIYFWKFMIADSSDASM